MNIRHRLSPEDMREKILVVAEEHFRRIGYGKTAVADIAAAMNMSPANIYRFFPSKLAINDALCSRIMQETDALIGSIVARDEPASVRLVSLIVELHRHNKAKLTDEHRLFDMVEVAIEENWPAIEKHCECLVCQIGKVVAEGIAAGEFRAVEPLEFAHTAFNAAAKAIHPTMIAQCTRFAAVDQEDQARRIAGLILDALRP
ncbi:AcrR Transcriptional regulator [Rhabdaerophilaceae bacterium]